MNTFAISYRYDDTIVLSCGPGLDIDPREGRCNFRKPFDQSATDYCCPTIWWLSDRNRSDGLADGISKISTLTVSSNKKHCLGPGSSCLHLGFHKLNHLVSNNAEDNSF